MAVAVRAVSLPAQTDRVAVIETVAEAVQPGSRYWLGLAPYLAAGASYPRSGTPEFPPVDRD